MDWGCGSSEVNCPVETERQGWRRAREGSSEKVTSLVNIGAAKEMSGRKMKGRVSGAWRAA